MRLTDGNRNIEYRRLLLFWYRDLPAVGFLVLALFMVAWGREIYIFVCAWNCFCEMLCIQSRIFLMWDKGFTTECHPSPCILTQVLHCHSSSLCTHCFSFLDGYYNLLTKKSLENTIYVPKEFHFLFLLCWYLEVDFYVNANYIFYYMLDLNGIILSEVDLLKYWTF